MKMDSLFLSKIFCYAIMLAVLVGSLIADAQTLPAVYQHRFGKFGGKWKYLTHLNLVSNLEAWLMHDVDCAIYSLNDYNFLVSDFFVIISSTEIQTTIL